MTEDEIIEHGKQVFEDCYRGVVPMPPHVEPSNFGGLTMKMFHDFWGGLDELSMREKRMVVLGGLIANGRADMMTIHAECALRNGEMDADTLRSVVKMALPYVGFPAASPCYLAVEKVIAKCRQDGVAGTGDAPGTTDGANPAPR